MDTHSRLRDRRAPPPARRWSPRPSGAATRRGFTLNELLLSITITCLLGALAIPRYIEAVESSRATGAYTFLACVAAAQERHCAEHGHYATRLADLDVDLQLPTSFLPGRIEVPCVGLGADQGWTLSGASADGTTWQAPVSDKSPPVSPGQQSGWRLCVRRVGFAAGLGEYTLVFSQRGFEAADSTVPDEISPVSGSACPDEDDEDDEGDWGDDDDTSGTDDGQS